MFIVKQSTTLMPQPRPISKTYGKKFCRIRETCAKISPNECRYKSRKIEVALATAPRGKRGDRKRKDRPAEK